MTSQVIAGVHGEERHSAHGLVPHRHILDRNVALHAGFSSSVLPSEMTNAQKRKFQRGASKSCVTQEIDPHIDLELEDLPKKPSETRVIDTPDTDTVLPAQSMNENQKDFVTHAELRKSLRDFEAVVTKVTSSCLDGLAAESMSDILRPLVTEPIAVHASLLNELQRKSDTLETSLNAITADLQHMRGLIPDSPPEAQSHSKGVSHTYPLCKFFARGRCRNGSDCSFEHVLPRWSDDRTPPDSEETQSAEFLDCVDLPEEPPVTDPSGLVGSTVRTFGLTSHEFNDRFGLVLGFVQSSSRFRVQFDPQTIRAFRKNNLQYPALCPKCEFEVTSNSCFNCGFGA